MESGRNPALAGKFYPANPKALRADLSEYFSQTKTEIKNDHIRAIIVPHAGMVYSGRTAAWGYRQLNNLPHPHFVLIGPSHHMTFTGLATSGQRIWKTPLGDVGQEPPETLPREGLMSEEAHKPEHDIEVQLPFLQYLFPEFSFTAFLTGTTIDIQNVSNYLVDQFPDSQFIISSDLSHYLPDSAARVRDKKTIDAIVTGNTGYILTEDNVACGNLAIAIVMELAHVYHWRSREIHYDTSASAFGDTSQVVGYSSIVWYEE
jgi:MEMO1 family protein